MKIEFNGKSILNNPIARTLNYLILIFTIYIFSNAKYSFNMIPITISLVIGSILSTFFTYLVIKNTEFKEDNKRERDKRNQYIIYILLINGLFCNLLTVSLSVGTIYIIEYGLFGIIFYLFSLVFLLNIINAPSLYYPLFEDILKITSRNF